MFSALGVLAVWWSYAVSNVAACALCVAWLLWGSWRRQLIDRPVPAGA
jgi:Na+-driven multidrug efflux pump